MMSREVNRHHHHHHRHHHHHGEGKRGMRIIGMGNREGSVHVLIQKTRQKMRYKGYILIDTVTRGGCK